MTGRFLAVSLTLIVFACAGFWRATGWEAAQAGERLSERGVSVAGSSRSANLYQGKPAIWWARRAVQARKAVS